MGENLRGILLMVGAMAAFAVEDMFIKRMGAAVPPGQILMMLGAGGAAGFALLARLRGERLLSPVFFSRAVVLRNLGELTGTLGFVTAIVLTPLSSASAILQAMPLAVTLGAALVFREPVGWRRWSAILAGFLGVLIVIRPGTAGFEPASLFALLGVAGLATRDLASRAVPRSTSSVVLSAWGFSMLLPTGAILLWLSGGATVPSAGVLGLLAGAVLLGIAGYYAITQAMRMGEVAVITPFRYTRIVFALVIGVTVFGERPDAWTLGGAALIIASGLYTLWREARLGRRRGALSAGPASPGQAPPARSREAPASRP
ncbi:EamA/RhaT family transporter [Rhodosalinus halophilus]|uniref:EamA/RhaT family transporter n=1 Tax=Rhodosalinus halophilus TaxID=2259333 RepID=A0A365U4K2_9RHOB|nr:DMT family transporter [Rhodosalinus halophilus]RBI82862.1 EamA/RhaT family transporter [Rhodosalinus halophilus]